MTFLLPVIMINLFIGLAVGDLEKVRENAMVAQRQLQIALYSFLNHIPLTENLLLLHQISTDGL